MTLNDFGLSVLASWLANKIDRLSRKSDADIPSTIPAHKESPALEPKSRLFRTYDIFHDLEAILPALREPVAHLLVETSPSTFYHLVCLVLESRATGEWYVFRRGRVAFQGTGGGLRQAERAVGMFREFQVPVAVWAVGKHELDSFEEGIVLWSELRGKSVPFFSAAVSSDDWSWIQQQAKELLGSSTQRAN